MHIVSAENAMRLLDDLTLVERLRRMFQTGCEVPLRHHHHIAGAGGGGTLLLMPAWRAEHHLGIKCVTVFPANANHGLPSVIGLYLLLDARTGAPLAQIDGVALTLRRTAAASALASSYLSRPETSRLLMVGAGALAPHLIGAHAALRPIERVDIWNRNPDKAARLAARLNRPGLAVRAAADLRLAAERADLISSATLSQSPLIHGDWLKPGTHLDLVGGFTPEMRETDDQALRRASIFVDTRQGAANEAGDIVDPLRRGVIAATDIRADLFELCRGQAGGRSRADEITLFKSVGTALEDLAAAELILERL